MKPFNNRYNFYILQKKVSNTKNIPLRILNFKRPKWFFLKKFIEKSFDKKKRYSIKKFKLVKSQFFKKLSTAFIYLFFYSTKKFDLKLTVKSLFFYLFFTKNKKSCFSYKKLFRKKSKKKKLISHLFFVKKPFKFLEKSQKFYKNSRVNFLLVSKIWSGKVSFYKLKTKISKYREHNILKFSIKPFYQVFALLTSLKFFSSIHQLSNGDNCLNILVNNQVLKKNHLLKRGDIISLKKNYYFSYFIHFLEQKTFDTRIFPFIEYDFETETIVVVKDSTDLSISECSLFVQEFIDIKKLRVL